MNAIADKYCQSGVGSVFIYTHEAHPGEFYPHLTSMEQKFRHARALKVELDVTRPIFVDALDGACHRAYGSMPNMSWIFNRSGLALYKADWTDASSVANAVEYLLEVAGRRRAGERMAPFRVERLDYRKKDRQAFDKGLERNGPKAEREFFEAFGPNE